MMKIKENFSLKKHNSFNIDANARFFAEASSLDDIKSILTDTSFISLPRLIIGEGCNILFTKNFEGLIIKINTKGIIIEEETAEYAIVESAAGENWDNLVEWTIEKNLSGIENLSLIPGSVGAAPVQNIGAYGVELMDVFHQLVCLEIDTLKLKTLSAAECRFGYRDSIFKHAFKNNHIIISVALKLIKKQHIKSDYDDIRNELSRRNIINPDIKTIRDIVCRIRREKLPHPTEIGNAGSFFKNPVIDESQLFQLLKKFPNIKYHKTDANKYKIAAGWLIENCGWKGKRIGEAGVHSRQALVIVNHGKATGSDILNLASNIVFSVKEKFGITLQNEVNII